MPLGGGAESAIFRLLVAEKPARCATPCTVHDEIRGEQLPSRYVRVLGGSLLQSAHYYAAPLHNKPKLNHFVRFVSL